MNKQGVTSLGMAVDMIKTGIDEPQVTTIDSQFVTEQQRRQRDGSLNLSRLRRIHKELLAELKELLRHSMRQNPVKRHL